jgi:cyclopropane fatty-acyl-phospholipid synthase-like methyltransferase
MRGDFLFSGVPLLGAHVLEVGCGTGAWAIWAALHGADHVVGIEPGADGSSQGTLDRLRSSIMELGLESRIQARAAFLHELPMPERPYDVVVMYNVINHLDEEAVIVLDRDQSALARYIDLLKDLRSRMRFGGWLIIADCGRDNFWVRLGLQSPFVPSIEWHKHQNPRTWISVLDQAGFRTMDLRWSPLQPFTKLTANRFVQYLTCSHFVLRLQPR